MKLQFGILHDNQRATSLDDLKTLLGEYASWNAETTGQIFDGPLLIGYRGDKITWEEDAERQPYAFGLYTLTFDGRLDNREELASRLGLTANHNLPDPQLIAEAYARYGPPVLSDLIGEFAIVLWRTDTRELMFVRSVDGARPLYYTLESDTLIWSSDIVHLLRTAPINPKLNEDYVWEYLIGCPASHMTPFANIHSVKSGTALRFVNKSFQPEISLWEPRHIAPLKYKCDADYEERLRYELAAAVRVRLRTKHPVFSALSGGLDSSSVVMTADTILRQDNIDPCRLRTLSAVYDTSTTCDERYFIRLIETKRGIPSIYVTEDEQAFTMGLRDTTFRGIPNILHLHPGRYPVFAERMKTYNSRVLLTGHGGDHIFCSAPRPEMQIADLLQEGRLRYAHQLCASWSRFTGVPYFHLLLGKALPLAASSLLPPSLRYDLLSLPSWLNLPHNYYLLLRQSIMNCETRLAPSHRFRIGMTAYLFRTISSGLWNNYADLYVSHPYTHRPLVEFCMAVPLSQMQRPGETRSLLRRALADRLPAKIVNRRSKGILAEVYARAIQKEWSEFANVQKWEICARGYVKAKELFDALQHMRLGIYSDSGASFALIAVVLERFLRSLRTLPWLLSAMTQR